MPIHSSTCSSSFTSFANGETPFSSTPSDVIDAHILTKMDGPTLASVACVSTQLRSLSLNENLWMKICYNTWPSINHPRVRDAISTFPSGYRSFFFNSFPTLHFHRHPQQTQTQTLVNHHNAPSSTREVISAVDIRYKNKVVYSNIQVTNTSTEGFLLWPICVDLVNKRDSPVKLRFEEEEELVLSEHVKLSWIMIDPTRKQAVNLSSIRPVLVEELYLNEAYKRIRYSTLMVSSESERETVEFQIVVTCGGICKGELGLWEVNLQVVNGVPLNGKEGLVILHKAMENNGRMRMIRGKRRELSMRKETELVGLKVEDYACIFVLSVAFTGWIFWSCFRRFILRRKIQM